LALTDLSALRPVFADPRIRKIFHGADYDIRSLHRNFGIEVENLFDTQLASRFLGLRETGLEALLRIRFQVELNKKYQRADWSRRPLTAEMAEYAAMDTRYLIPLSRALEAELKEKGRAAWAEEECLLLSRVRFSPPAQDPLYLRVKGASSLDPRSLAALETLLQFREAEARRLDLPPFKVLPAEALLELAAKKTQTPEELEEGKGLGRKLIDRYGARLLQEIQRAMDIPEQDLAAFPREARPDFPPAVRKRIKTLKTWRETKAAELGLEPGTILNNALINLLALKSPRSQRELEEIPGLKEWQGANFGGEILRAL
jgi:ribonuclease D